MGNWRIKAKRIIQAALREAKAKGIGGRALRRYITKSYPAYGYLDEQGRPIRGKYPYRVWLEELDAVMFLEISGCAQMGLNLGDA